MEFDLEAELQLELEKLDLIFQESTGVSASNSLDSVALSHSVHNTPGKFLQGGDDEELAAARYELAEAEIEKEDLEDKVQLLRMKLEQYDTEMLSLTQQNLELRKINDTIKKDNEELLLRLGDREHQLSQLSLQMTDQSHTEQHHHNASISSLLGSPGGLSTGLGSDDKPSYEVLEMKVKTLVITSEILLRDLQKEKALRTRAEKEKEAYQKALDRTMKKVEEWAKSREKRVSSGSNGSSGQSRKNATANGSS